MLHPRGKASAIGRVIAFSSSFLRSAKQVVDLLALLSSSGMQYQMPIRDARQRPSEKQRVGERSARASSMLHFHHAKAFCINGIGFLFLFVSDYWRVCVERCVLLARA